MIVASIAACSSDDAISETSPKETEKSEKSAGEAKSEVELPQASKACLRKYPARSDLGEGMDPEQVRAACERVVKDKSVCTPEIWISLEAAACIARGAGLPISDNWKGKMWISNFAPHRVTWKIELVEDRDYFLVIDAVTGKIQTLPDPNDLTPFGVTSP